MKISFFTIGTSSLEESIKFYQEVLDFELEKRFSPRPGVEIAFLSDKHNSKIELIQRGPISPSENCPISISFEVDDINAVKEHLDKHNVKITSGPTELPSKVKLLHAQDPNGVALGFVEYQK